MALEIFDCVVADLSLHLLEAFPGTMDSKLTALQWHLRESDIIIQYVCGDDEESCVVQLKGTWASIIHVRNILGSVVNGKIIKVEPDSEPSKQGQHTLANDDAACDFAKDEEQLGLITAGPHGKAHLCEYCGEKKLKPAESCDQGCQTLPGNSSEVVQPETVYVSHPVLKAQVSSTNHGKISKRGRASLSATTETTVAANESSENTLELGTVYDKDIDEDSFSDALQVRDLSSVLVKEEDSESLAEELFMSDSPGEDASADEKEEVSGARKKTRKVSNDVSYVTRSVDDMVVYEPIEEDEPVVRPYETRGRKRKCGMEEDLIKENNLPEVISKCMKKAIDDGGALIISCLMCDFKTSARRHLRSHIQRCHMSHRSKCNVCGKTYGLEKDLRAHLRAHFPKLTCHECGARFSHRSILEKHVQRIHLASKEGQTGKSRQAMHTCDYCDFWTLKSRKMEDHIARQHGERNFQCSECNKTFGLEKDMKEHLKGHSDAFLCVECGDKRFRSRSALQIHHRTVHQGEKIQPKPTTYICDLCGHVCRNKTLFTEHLNKNHLKIKPFQCPLCDMAFHSKVSLKNHLNTHGQDRKHSCQVCNKSFKTVSSLRVHTLTHVDVAHRPYVCEHCKKTFSQRGALVRHERIHTGIKPYPCKFCDSAFNDYSILRRHMLGVHKINRRDLCQRPDVRGNKGGPKPDRMIVANIDEYQETLRTIRGSTLVKASMVAKDDQGGEENEDEMASATLDPSELQVIELYQSQDEEIKVEEGSMLSEVTHTIPPSDVQEYYAVPAQLSQVTDLIPPQYPFTIQAVSQPDNNITYQIIPHTEGHSLLQTPTDTISLPQ